MCEEGGERDGLNKTEKKTNTHLGQTMRDHNRPVGTIQRVGLLVVHNTGVAAVGRVYAAALFHVRLDGLHGAGDQQAAALAPRGLGLAGGRAGRSCVVCVMWCDVSRGGKNFKQKNK